MHRILSGMQPNLPYGNFGNQQIITGTVLFTLNLTLGVGLLITGSPKNVTVMTYRIHIINYPGKYPGKT